MRFSTRSRPSPAMVVAVFALVFAMVGTAVAGPDALSRAVTKSKVKKVSKKQANKAITKRAPGLSVGHANVASTVVDGAVTAPKLGTIVTRVDEVNIPDGAGNAASASCQAGERLISGGARVVLEPGQINSDVQLTSSRPQTAGVVDSTDPANGQVPAQWRAGGFNPAGGVGTVPLRVFAICIQ